VTTPGTCFVFDTERNVRSASFKVDQRVYKDVLKASLRTFFYQRSGFAKQQPYAEPCWTDSRAYMGPGQDSEARDITDKYNAAKVRDLSGGWFDAGDTNKYVTFAARAVHPLLTAYQENPAVFTDDFNIPESGNGIPDLLDEVKWETDWLKKMQYPDGTAALKVGEISYVPAAPPSSDHSPRYYVPACTSASVALAGMLAHASLVFGATSALASEASELKSRAIAAWQAYQRVTPKQVHCDTGIVHAGNADWSEEDQAKEAAVAAIYLFAITGEAQYEQYLKLNYKLLKPYHDMGWTRYEPEQGEALLFYTTLPRADPQLRQTVLADKLADVKGGNQIYGWQAEDDLYRAFLHPPQYHWGSSWPRSQYGNTNMDAVRYVPEVQNKEAFVARALQTLHYFHGVNPLAMVYLSNMYGYGATRSANEIYHTWFWHDTRWSDALASACGPAPGFIPGGPNAFAAQAGVPETLRPPVGQPPQKSYRDYNAEYPQDSWAITEPAIYFQASYVKLLSKFAD
jgi:hypothetical protein